MADRFELSRRKKIKRYGSQQQYSKTYTGGSVIGAGKGVIQPMIGIGRGKIMKRKLGRGRRGSNQYTKK